MREIKFRGLSENNQWYYGYLNIMGNGQFVILVNSVGYGVRAETIGQYTGLKDKNGKEIYEGDIVKRLDGGLRVVNWNGTAGWVVASPMSIHGLSEPNHWEVIGNIYENSELIKSTDIHNLTRFDNT